MSAPRSAVRGMRNLYKPKTPISAGAGATTTRALHITGPSTYPSPTLNRDIESSRRPTLETAKVPIQRLDDTLLSSEKYPQKNGSRNFNTSRALHAVRDSSTIDFAYLPDMHEADYHDKTADVGWQVRMPLLPSAFFPTSTKTSYTPEEEEIVTEVMKPEIVLASASSTHIYSPAAMAEVHDNSTIDFEGLADTVKSGVKSLQSQTEKEMGIFMTVWNGMLDDILGSRFLGGSGSNAGGKK